MKEKEHVEGFAPQVAWVTRGGDEELEERLDRPADVGSDHRHDVREVDQVVARSAGAHQPVGERRPLGEGDAAVPAHDGVPLAGRAHGARDRRRGRGGDAEDSRALQGVRRERARDARRRRHQERQREVRRRVAHVLDRGADGRRPRAAGRHVAQPRAELREGVRDPVPGPRQDAAARLDDVVGRVDAADRRRDHDARRRQRSRAAAERRAVSGRDRADSARQLEGDRAAEGRGDSRRADGEGRAREARRERRELARLEVRRVGAARRAAAARDRARRIIEKAQVFSARRDTREKAAIPLADLATRVPDAARGDSAQPARARARSSARSTRARRTRGRSSRPRWKAGRASSSRRWCGSAECEAAIKAETQATLRNIPLGSARVAGQCVKCNGSAQVRPWFAKAY